MKSGNLMDFNRTQKFQFNKKIKIINLNKKKSEGKRLFSQSLYLSNFLQKNKDKKIPDSSKFQNCNSTLIVSKSSKFIPNMKKTFKNNQKLKLLELNKANINNSFNQIQFFKQSEHNTNPNYLILNNNENSEHGVIYEDNIKLKTKINKLKLELFFAKSLNKKKDEEIKELNKYLDDAKFFFGKKGRNHYLKRIKNDNIIIKLKDSYENIKSKYREKNNINNALMNKIKKINLEEMIKNIEEDIKILKNNSEVLKSKELINSEISKKLEKVNWKKNKFLENYQFLIKLKQTINQKLSIIENLSEKAYYLRDKYYNIKSQKRQIVRYNRSIKLRNEELLLDKKYRQDLFMKRSEIERQIFSYTIKSKDLSNKLKSDEYSIKSYLDRQNNNFNSKNDFFEYIPQLEPNPNKDQEKQVFLYESLIKDSKIRQRNLIKLLKDLIENTSNNNINDIKDNSKIFEDNLNINSDINDIKIEYQGEKYEKDKDFQFLLNIMFYIKNIKKERIQNILLSYKTENYYLGNLNENYDFISELTSDILIAINNKSDINKLKEILNYLFEYKYKSNKIQFLNKIINDIYILDNPKEIFFVPENEVILFIKLQNFFSKKISNINKQLKKFKEKKILYENIKEIFIEEKLYEKNNKEKMKLFQFFIYIMKKRENTLNQNNALNEFNTKDIIDFFCDLEEDIIYHDNFFKALKNLLNDKKKDLYEFIGNKKTIDISEFIEILKENEFEIKDDNFDLNNFLKKYQLEQNSENINIELLKMELDNISVF